MKRVLLLCLVFVLLLVACKKEPTAQEIMNGAAAKMSEATSLEFAITRQGTPAEVALGDTTVGVTGANGQYEAPNKVHATVQAQASGFTTEADVLWVPEGKYFMHPLLSPSYSLVDLEGFDAPAIFTAEQGIPAVLQSLGGATIVGTEDIDGVQAYHITADAQGEALTGLTGSVLAAGTAKVDLWIAVDTSELIRLQVTEADGNGWTVDFFNYNQPVAIPTP
jgi:hypothetical protein